MISAFLHNWSSPCYTWYTPCNVNNWVICFPRNLSFEYSQPTITCSAQPSLPYKMMAHIWVFNIKWKTKMICKL
jgi:hypothetical protein